MRSRPLLIGVTGGIGSGKSLVCRVFKVLGVPVYDADSGAKWLMENDTDLIGALQQAFGDNVYQNGILQREYLGRIVFADPEKLKILNSLTHPAVGRHFEKWVEKHLQYPYLVKEAALFIESGTYRQLDRLVLVTASDEVRIARVLKRDQHRTEKDIRNVIGRQMPESEKMKYCHYIVQNDGNVPVLETILSLDREFRLLADELTV